MKFTKEEKALAKQLKEFGVRRKIKYGDWYIIKRKSILCAYSNDCFRRIMGDKIIPLWQIHDCLEWLREKSWFVWGFGEHESGRDNIDTRYWVVNITEAIENGVYIYSPEVTKHCKETFGKTPLEALLKAIIEVKKEQGNG